MKFSQFNISIPYNNLFVWYNSLSNYFLSIDSLQNELLNAAKHSENIDELLVYDPVLYTELITKDFIVSNDKNEIDAVRQIQRRIDIEDDTLYHLTINPTMNCNFKVSIR